MFKRTTSQFRKTIPSSEFPAEAGRYAIYFNYGCPWAHRTLIVRHLKSLQDIIELVEVDSFDVARGWTFSGEYGPSQDPITGEKYLRDVYRRSDPKALENGIASVPVLFDKKTGTIVNNESSEIIRILYSGFDSLLPAPLRESSKGPAALLPPHLQPDIDEMNAWVYEKVNNGPYRVGFARTQEAYEANIPKFYEGLDAIERHLEAPEHRPYLFGEHITEADIRLYPTLVRWDPAYSRFFARGPSDVRFIRDAYPRAHDWLRNLYWDESERTNGGAFKHTVKLERMREGIVKLPNIDTSREGPSPDVLPL